MNIEEIALLVGMKRNVSHFKYSSNSSNHLTCELIKRNTSMRVISFLSFVDSVGPGCHTKSSAAGTKKLIL